MRELAIPLTARTVSQPFEWVIRAKVARPWGLPGAVIQAVHARQDPTALPPRYAKAARVVRHVLAFESIELVVLAGYYRLIAGVLFAFDVPLPEGESPPF